MIEVQGSIGALLEQLERQIDNVTSSEHTNTSELCKPSGWVSLDMSTTWLGLQPPCPPLTDMPLPSGWGWGR